MHIDWRKLATSLNQKETETLEDSVAVDDSVAICDDKEDVVIISEEIQTELKITQEAQLAMNILCRFVESRIDLASETFKIISHLKTIIELEKEKKNTAKCIRLHL